VRIACVEFLLLVGMIVWVGIVLVFTMDFI